MTNEQLSILIESWANRLRIITGSLTTAIEDLEDKGAIVPRASIPRHVAEDHGICLDSSHIKYVPEGEIFCMRPLLEFVDELDDAITKLGRKKTESHPC